MDKRCHVLCGSENWAILCVIVKKILNNMLLCVKIMFIYAINLMY